MPEGSRALKEKSNKYYDWEMRQAEVGVIRDSARCLLVIEEHSSCIDEIGAHNAQISVFAEPYTGAGGIGAFQHVCCYSQPNRLR